MAFQVMWSGMALTEYMSVVEYLSNEWPRKVVKKFVGKMDFKVELLLTNPSMGIKSTQDKDVRSVLVTYHNRLYYQILNDIIEVPGVLDTRQDPLKNRFK